MEQIRAEKTSVKSNNKDLSNIYKYYKEIETAKDKPQSRIDSLSTNIETTWYKSNEAIVVLVGEFKRVVTERYRAVSSM